MTTYMHVQADYTAAGSTAHSCRLCRIRLQVRYAAEDARVGFELLLALHARCLPPVPLDTWVQRQLAAAPPRRPSKPATPPRPPGASPPGRNSALGGGGAPGGAAPSEPKKRQLPGPSRATPLYDGWMMAAPDGTPMCRLSRQRAEWYVGALIPTPTLTPESNPNPNSYPYPPLTPTLTF